MTVDNTIIDGRLNTGNAIFFNEISIYNDLKRAVNCIIV